MTNRPVLNYEPIRSLFYWNGDKVMFCEERLLALCPTDMYSWMYQIADAVRKVRQ